MLCQIIYSSRAARPMDSTQLEKILVDARRGNEERDVTGALIYVRGVFVQVLEGECDVLDTLVNSIRNDKRHDSMKVVHRAEVHERAFGNWRMAYLNPDAQEMARWLDLEGSASIEELLENIQQGKKRIPRILVGFAEAIARKRD